MKKIKSGDKIKVITGKHKGTVSVVEQIKGDKALVKGVNIVKRAMKGKGIIEITKPIHISNIMLFVEGTISAPKTVKAKETKVAKEPKEAKTTKTATKKESSADATKTKKTTTKKVATKK